MHHAQRIGRPGGASKRNGACALGLSSAVALVDDALDDGNLFFFVFVRETRSARGGRSVPGSNKHAEGAYEISETLKRKQKGDLTACEGAAEACR